MYLIIQIIRFYLFFVDLYTQSYFRIKKRKKKKDMASVTSMDFFHSRHFERKAQVLLITSTMASFHSSVPLSHDGVTVSQNSSYQVSETEAAKRTSTIINFNTYTCVFPTVTCLNLFRKRRVL